MTITDFSALSLRLPLLDTATLSQAWRDALHRAQPRRANAVTEPRRESVARTGAVSHRDVATCGNTRAAQEARMLRQGEPMRLRPPAGATLQKTRHRPVAPTPHVRRAAPATTVPKREHMVVALPDGTRICFVIRSLADHLNVTVLCAPHVQQTVRTALAHALRGYHEQTLRTQIVAASEAA